MKKNYLNLIKLRKADIFKIMKWRNEQIKILRQKKKLSKKDQLKYFNAIDRDSKRKKPKNILYSIIDSKEKKCIGYGGFVYVNWVDKKAEMSFLLDTNITKNIKKYNLYFDNFIASIKKEFFNKHKLNKLFTETFSFRKNTIKTLERNNFKKVEYLKQNFYKKKNSESLIHSLLRRDCLNKKY